MIKIIESIVLGLISQTESGKIKWMNSAEFAKANKESSYLKDRDVNLQYTFYHQLDNNTLIEVDFHLRNDHSYGTPYTWIKNKQLQSECLYLNSTIVPELKNLEKILFEKYIQPRLILSKKSYKTDIELLEKIASKCGIEAVRDMKINQIIDEPGRFSIGNIFNKIKGKS